MLIGIGGVSRSGKSTLASELCNLFRGEGKTCMVISQDDFVKPISEIPKIDSEVDWEHPSGFRHETLLKAIDFLRPQFDILIVDGILAFYDSELKEKYTAKLFVEISKEEFMVRKSMDHRWGYVPLWYYEHIWKSFENYGIPDFSKDSYLKVAGNKPYNMKSILNYCEEALNPKHK